MTARDAWFVYGGQFNSPMYRSLNTKCVRHAQSSHELKFPRPTTSNVNDPDMELTY